MKNIKDINELAGHSRWDESVKNPVFFPIISYDNRNNPYSLDTFIYKDLWALPTPDRWNNLKDKDTKLKTLPVGFKRLSSIKNDLYPK